MSEARWRITTAQADAGVGDAGAAGDIGGDATDVTADPAEATGQELPANFATRLGSLAILNFIQDKFQKEANDFGIPPADFANMVTTQITQFKAQNMLNDAAFLTVISVSGQRPESIRAQTGVFAGLFTNLAETYNKAEVQQQQAIAMQYCEEPVGQDWNGGKGSGQALWKSLGERFQVIFNGVVQKYKASQAQNVQPFAAQGPQQAAPAQAPALAKTDKWVVEAQVQDQGQGPLAAGRYESVSEFRDDLIRMGPNPQTYERIMTLVGPDKEDDAKDALGSFFQGLAASLYTLYDMLVDVGMASPLDAEIVETLMSQHPELSNQNNEQKPPTQAGLFLPPCNSGIYTKSDKLEKIAATGAYPAYMSYGPGDERMCPKIRQPVSTYICRYHCLDGLNIDDGQTLCGEAIWRQAVMDKFSSEYRDKDGNWVGGYLNKRFEIHRDDGGHPALLKPGERSAPIHEDAWSVEKRLTEMRKTESKSRGYSETPGDGPKDLYNFDQHELMKGPKNPQLTEKKKDSISKLASADSMFEKEAAKGDFKNVPWAKPEPQEGGDDEPSAKDLQDAKIKPPKKKKEPWPPKNTPFDGPKKKAFNLKRQKMAADFVPSVDDVNQRGPGIKDAELNYQYEGRNHEGEKMYRPDLTVTFIGPDSDQYQTIYFSGESNEEVLAKYHAWAGQLGFEPKEPIDWVDRQDAEYHGEMNNWAAEREQAEQAKIDSEQDRTLDKTIQHLEKPRGTRNPWKQPPLMAGSGWAMTKEAWGIDMSNAGGGGDKMNGMGENVNHGRVGKKCPVCGKVFGADAMVCDGSGKPMANGQMHPHTPLNGPNANYNQGDAERATGAINNSGMLPAALNAEVVVANGVYRASKDGKSAFGDTPEQAVEKLARGLADLAAPSLDQEADTLLNFRQQDDAMKEMPPAVQNPNTVPAPISDVQTPAPAPQPQMGGQPKITMEDGKPLSKTSPVPNESQGPSEFFPPETVPATGWKVPGDEADVSANELDKHLEAETAAMHPEHQSKVTEQAIASGAHPRQGE